MNLNLKPTLRGLAFGALLLLASGSTGCLDTQGLFTKGYIPPYPEPTPTPQVAMPAALPSASPAAVVNLEFAPPLESLPGYKEDQNKKNPMPGDAASIARGKDLYSSNCAICHGDSGKGDGPNAPLLPFRPRNLTQGVYQYGGEDWQLYRTIAEGIPPSPMQSWKAILGDDKSIWDVVNYVRSLAKNAPAASPAAPAAGGSESPASEASNNPSPLDVTSASPTATAPAATSSPGAQ